MHSSNLGLNHHSRHLRECVLFSSLVALLCGCAPSTRVTLLPQANGSASAVAVSSDQGTQLIAKPYQVVAVGRKGALSVESTTAEQVSKVHGGLLALEPQRAESFLLQFEPGTSNLTPASLVLLSTIVARAKARIGGDIVVTGHTDRQGTQEANDELSLKRARSVRDLLIKQGFLPERIEAVGRGEREPVVPTEDEVAEPSNRRAEVLVR